MQDISTIITPLSCILENLDNEAKMLGKLLGIPNNLIKPSDGSSYLTIIIGHDYKSIFARLESQMQGVQ